MIARTSTLRRTHSQTRADGAARRAQAHHQKRLAAADAAARGLRQQLAAITARYRDVADAAAAPAGGSPSAGAAVGVLAGLLERCDARAGIYAQAAVDARAAGLTCDDSYDAVRRSLMHDDQDHRAGEAHDLGGLSE